MLETKAKDDREDVLYKNFVGLEKKEENFSTTPERDKILVKNIKGRIAGNTLKAQAVIPFSVDCK